MRRWFYLMSFQGKLILIRTLIPSFITLAYDDLLLSETPVINEAQD